jgi:hypothetical protein
MNPENPDRKDLMELMKDIPASSIPLAKEITETPKALPNLNNLTREIWASKSNQLLDDYRYGESLAKFGENNLTTKTFIKRFTFAICAAISNEFQKRGVGAEDMKPLYAILEANMLLIAKEIDKKDLKDFDISSIIASMQGFIINYIQPKEIK